MRLLQIDIERFGIFQQTSLTLDRGLQLIHGPNEAGKSTLLQLIRELFFGFPQQNPYVLDGGPTDGEIAACGVLEMANGQTLEFRRRKGRKDAVKGLLSAVPADGVGPTVVDADRLAQLLGNASADLYRHVFGFSLSELSAAEKSLENATLLQALYGGGIGGLAHIQRLQVALRESHEQLFAPKAKTREINACLGQIAAHDRDLRASMVKPSHYQQTVQSCEQADADVARLREELATVHTQLSRQQRLADALAYWQQREEARRQLADIRVPAGIPTDAATRAARLQERRDECDQQRWQSEQHLTEIADQLTRLTLRPELLQQTQAIRSWQQQIAKIRGFRRDLPLRQQEANQLQADLLQQLQALEPTWGLAELKRFQTSLEHRHAIEELAEAKQHAERNLQEHRQQVRRLLCEDQIDRQRLEALAVGESSLQLAAQLQQRDSYTRARQTARETAAEMEQLQLTIEHLRQEMSAPLNRPVTDSEFLPLPLDRTVAEFGTRLVAAEQDCLRRQEQYHRLEQELQEHQRSLDDAEREIDVPDRDRLLDQRSRRDQAWRLLRRKYIRQEPVDDEIHRYLGVSEESLPEAYERAVRQADEMADLRQIHATTVARRETLARQLERGERDAKIARQHLKEAQQHQDAITREWHQLWGPCRIQPLSPNAMREWLRLHHRLLEKLELHKTLAQRLRSAQDASDDLEDELQLLLPKSTARGESLWAEADRQLGALREAEAERKSLMAHGVARLETLRQEEQQVVEIEQQLQEDRQRWQTVRATCGLPDGWSIELGVKMLSQLSEAREKHARLTDRERRIADMDQELRGFEEEVLGQRHLLAKETPANFAEDLALQLHQQLEIAVHDSADLQRLSAERERLLPLLESVRGRGEQIQQQLAELWQLAEVREEQEFHQVLEQAERRRQLLTQIDETSQRLAGLRGNEPADSFDAALQDVDPDAMKDRLSHLEQQRSQIADEHEESVKRAALYRNQLLEMEQSEHVLELQSALETSRGRLADAVERWAPLVMADALLKQAIQRFEQEHQPLLLQQVELLFQRLTNGRYVAVRRRLDDAGTMIVRQPDGTEKSPGQLSRGTREQLYLAMRLAYVRHYCQHAEPLPIIMDDVLVNFDSQRARLTLQLLVEFSQDVQVLFLTCHDHIVQLAREIDADLAPLRIDSGRQAVAAASIP